MSVAPHNLNRLFPKERDFENWITADWHLGEDRFKLMQRFGFTDAQDDRRRDL